MTINSLYNEFGCYIMCVNVIFVKKLAIFVKKPRYNHQKLIIFDKTSYLLTSYVTRELHNQ
jgi:hypothetical protein